MRIKTKDLLKKVKYNNLLRTITKAEKALNPFIINYRLKLRKDWGGFTFFTVKKKRMLPKRSKLELINCQLCSVA